MPRDVRAAENIQFFREVKKRTRQREGSWLSKQRIAFECECSNLGCRAPVYLTVEEFGLVRETRGQYIVVPDHVDLRYERVVAEIGHHAVLTSIEVEELVTEIAEPSGAQNEPHSGLVRAPMV